jgi:hypothetical protein
MRILFDHGTPRGLARELNGHDITTAKSQGWERLSNGVLLSAAEHEAFDLFLTTDQRIQYQQNLSGRKISIVVLSGTTKWSQVRLHIDRIAIAVNASAPGTYVEVFIPFKARKQQA